MRYRRSRENVLLASVASHAGLCRTWPKSPKTGFLGERLKRFALGTNHGYFSLFLHKTINCGYSSKSPHWDNSNYHAHLMSVWKLYEITN